VIGDGSVRLGQRALDVDSVPSVQYRFGRCFSILSKGSAVVFAVPEVPKISTSGCRHIVCALLSIQPQH
jgi:hypothetical protein